MKRPGVLLIPLGLFVMSGCFSDNGAGVDPGEPDSSSSSTSGPFGDPTTTVTPTTTESTGPATTGTPSTTSTSGAPDSDGSGESGSSGANDESSSSGATDGSTANCGNGVLDPGEACDEGYAGNSDVDGTCTLACQFPKCGDGLVRLGHEECDLGQNNNDSVYNGCTTECKFGPSCGDGLVQGPEECDAGPDNGSGVPSSEDGVACESACRFLANVVFVSSATYTGKEVDGVTGAHGHCVELATTAGLDNADAFKAFISAVGFTPADHFVHADIPYVRLDGIRVADNWNDLIQNGPNPGIVVTETKDHLEYGFAWTGTGPDGEMFLPEQTCVGWTSDSPDLLIKGRVGLISPDPDDKKWTSDASLGCAYPYRLLCFEQ
jgi:hypothetical protein